MQENCLLLKSSIFSVQFMSIKDQQLFVEAKKDELNSLLEIAKIQSTKSSNRIEGIFTTDKRLEELMQKKSEPRNRNEQEISGYRDVLSTIHESYDYISPTSNIIQQLQKSKKRTVRK